MGAVKAGVGGRQGAETAPTGGGGYPDDCNKKKFDLSDSRLNELRAIGLQRSWLSLAALIGVDNFLTVWRVLCQEIDMRGDMQRIYVPRFRTYLRYQRNRTILALSSEGMDSRAIRAELRAATGEDMNEQHINRIISRHKRMAINED